MLDIGREMMVSRQIKSRGIRDEKVLASMEKVPRHLFVPEEYRDGSYEDHPIPIGFGQTISQPYIVAYMTEALGLRDDYRVLEIGAGSGYQAAVLSDIVEEVYTVEIIKELADAAAKRLETLGYDNVRVKHGDGYKGWPEYAPYDAIMVTAGPPEVPEGLIRQLRVGGRMIVPVGSFFQELYLITKQEKGYEKKALLPVRFVPMVREGER